MSIEGAFIDINGNKVLLRRTGAGEPLLFLHGAGGMPPWLSFFDQLAERFDLLVPDHPSYGGLIASAISAFSTWIF